MKKPNLLLLGPVTKDTICKNDVTYRNIGGAAYYQSTALTCLGADVTAVVTLAPEDKQLLADFNSDVHIIPVWTEHTMVFENIYPDNHNPNIRIQQANIPQNPILPEHLHHVNIEAFDAVYILPLSPYDVPLETVKYLSLFDKPIFMGAQGYLRQVYNGKVELGSWTEFSDFAPHVSMLFADDNEARYITGNKSDNLSGIAQQIILSGIHEVVLTQGDKGAFIATSHGEYRIPAFKPKVLIDPTGLGDTYMAAYSLQRLHKHIPKEAGELAATAATMKLEYKGAFFGSLGQVEERMKCVQEICR